MPLVAEQMDLVAAGGLRIIERDVGFRPSTSIEEGIGRFVDWYCAYHGVARLAATP